MSLKLSHNRNDERHKIPNPQCHGGAISLRALKKRVRFALALPRFLYGLITGYFYDVRRYYRAASKGNEAVCAGRPSYTELKSWIAADTHKIEKALSLREPRPGFGAAVVRRLVEYLQVFHSSFGIEQTTQIAVNTLLAYCHFNKEHNVDDELLYEQVITLANQAGLTNSAVGEGGVLKITRDAILAQALIPNIEKFFTSRYSIRDFSSAPVQLESIEKAVRMAQKTPSVCNRQSWKTYAYLDEKEMKRIFDFQQGNRGFGELAGGALVVTSDLATFFSYFERNQAWIDGGMFAMSLVYALHAVGLGSCCLNWSAEPSSDRALHKQLGIPENEVVIMIIAIGCLPDELNVAQSLRKPIEEVLVLGRLDGENSGEDGVR
ncbi:nitroreductase family protein [Candidatus Hydrogenedentota bacterium]